MKKFFILAISLCSLCSCAISNTYSTISCYGNVTTFTPQGDTLKVYKNVLIQERVGGYTTENAFKAYGLNFTDSTGKGIIVGNAVPYIVEYEVEVKVDTISTPDYYEEYTNDN